MPSKRRQRNGAAKHKAQTFACGCASASAMLDSKPPSQSQPSQSTFASKTVKSKPGSQPFRAGTLKSIAWQAKMIASGRYEHPITGRHPAHH